MAYDVVDAAAMTEPTHLFQFETDAPYERLMLDRLASRETSQQMVKAVLGEDILRFLLGEQSSWEKCSERIQLLGEQDSWDKCPGRIRLPRRNVLGERS